MSAWADAAWVGYLVACAIARCVPEQIVSGRHCVKSTIRAADICALSRQGRLTTLALGLARAFPTAPKP